MKTIFRLLPIIILFIFMLTACGGGQTSGTGHHSGHASSKQADRAFPVTMTDAMGNQVTFKKKPERIVSLIPSNTEITFALGAGNRVVGVTKFDDYPKAVKKVEKIGGQDFNVEKIISLHPDLVLALDSNARNSKDALDQIRHAGAKVLVVKTASSFADVYHAIKIIGKATGSSQKAADIVNHMKTKISKIKKKSDTIPIRDRVKAWVEVSASPDLYTTGSGTFMNEMLEDIHAKNVAADQKGWVKFSSEAAVKKKPDVIILTYGDAVHHAMKKVLNRPGWGNVPAVRYKRVYDVNPDLVTRSGPRLIKGVEQLAKVIYPDVFKK